MVPRDEEVAMLRTEIELLMAEREALLRTAGAAAAFVANLTSEAVPKQAFAAAEALAASLNDLDEDTLRDALDAAQDRFPPIMPDFDAEST